MFHAIRRAALLCCCLPTLAHASGLTFGENGARALSLGGAFAGQADDLTAIQHNPAGLALQRKGFSFLVDGQLNNQEVTFQKRNAAGADEGNLVSNTAGPFPTPFVALGYGLELGGKAFTVALGAYGPPAVGRYVYPSPNYAVNESGRLVENPAKFAPQRYALVEANTLLAYPGISVAYRVHERISVGASLQYVFSDLYFQQYLTAAPELGDPRLDAKVEVKMKGRPGVTGVLGVMATVTDTLQVGASVRPPVPVAADGQLVITLGDLLKDTAKVNGDRASLFLSMPLEIKLGAHWKPLPALSVNVDLVYEGWDSFSDLVIQPNGITQQVGNGTPVPLETLRIPKKWRSTLGARAGVGYTLPFGLQVRAGALFEQQASENKYFNIDFPNPQRLFVTGGVEYPVGPVSLLLTGAYSPTVSLAVTDSAVAQVTNNPAVPGQVVGNGVYTSGGWVASVGVRGNFGPQR